MEKDRRFSRKRLQYGTVAAASTAAVLVAAILLNVLMELLAMRLPLTLDLTPDHIFGISEESAAVVRGLEVPVHITAFINRNSLDQNRYMAQLGNILSEYKRYSSQVSVEYMDLYANPAFVSQYEDLDLQMYDILIECEGRTRKVNLNDMYLMKVDPDSGSVYVAASQAERLLTSAIFGATSELQTKVGLVTGHGESVPDGLEALLEQNNYFVEQVDLSLAGEIPADVGLLLMLGTERDPDEAALGRLELYLQNGGSYGKALFYAPSEDSRALPALDAFLAEWGIAVEPGLVLETDGAKVFNNTTYLCAVDPVCEDYTEDLPPDSHIISPLGRSVRILFDARSGHQTTQLLAYSDTSCVMPPTANDSWTTDDAEKHNRPALVRSTYITSHGNAVYQSSVFVLASRLSLDSSFLANRSVVNAEYYLRLFSTVSGSENTVSIASKDLRNMSLGIMQRQITLIGTLCIVVIPLSTLAAGSIVWLKRRHL